MTTIQFNTGRPYTKEGQVITATLYDDGIVTFMDHSRMIDGQLDFTSNEIILESDVVLAYDRGQYKSTLLSFQDGMSVDGLNARKED